MVNHTGFKRRYIYISQLHKHTIIITIIIRRRIIRRRRIRRNNNNNNINIYIYTHIILYKWSLGDLRGSPFRVTSFSSPRRSPRHQRCARSCGQAKRRSRGRRSSEVRSWAIHGRGSHGSLFEPWKIWRKTWEKYEKCGKMGSETSITRHLRGS